MPRRIRLAAAAVGLTALVGSLTAACGGSSSTSSAAAFDAANCTGGTLQVLDQATEDTGLDPAELYTSGGGAIPRLLFRTLTTRDTTAGADGRTVVPDLATDTGEPSANATVWTYHLKSGLKYADGQAITSADIKYGVERSFSSELAGGPPYLRDWLIGGETYQGPYGANPDLASITTPNATTIVFHLRKSEGDFPYLAAETQFAPVPKAEDTGKNYNADPVSSGPYTIQNFTKGKDLILTRNTYWSKSTDSQRLACPDTIDISFGLSATVIDQRLAASVGQDADAITTDTDVDAATLAKAAVQPSLKARLTSGNFPDTTYLAFNTTKAPFNNILVREAFSYAVDRTALVNAEGGSQLATALTTFTPPSIGAAYHPYDYFPAGATGNAAKAKQLLAQAGYPNGLTVQLAYDNNDPQDAAALQQAYAKAGITLKLNPIDDSSYDSVVTNTTTEPALSLFGWGADWPSGAPFLTPIFDGRDIVQGGGNFNLAQYDDPAVEKQIDQINQITDFTKAQQAWGDLDAQLGKLALDVPLYTANDVVLHGSSVKNTYVDQWRGWYDISSVSVK
ncbi:ABC transporter substrate-binding protein [Actinospica durhamensis]|uniref:ABC transporter substrate-binding protein n=1 Tax=Actinospica durhamensis TaxID=1508375 RepID=A0A941IT58_9ACTN|nr:ABC transporter substrate-binding protein [Actinospica durhamensis]MBR7837222.1 ABC transporter substrate-binding protein [Actinospica durhamensis]